MPQRPHVVIISWDGYHDKAAAIAAALTGATDKITVIYSNAADTPEAGHGTWVRVPHSWYFGRKFRHALDLVAPDEVMLLIQADTHSEDWAALAAGCAACFAQHPQVGLWIPDINWTPWPADVVGQGMLPQTNLMQVAQTDGIVWALHPDLLGPLRALSYAGNNLGWGIDWVALHMADTQGKIAVRDMSYPVHHPQSRGYGNAEAAQNMKTFLGQLPAPTQQAIMASYHRLAALRRTALGQDTPAHAPRAQAAPMPMPFLRDPDITQAIVIAGHVYLRTAGTRLDATASLHSDGIRIPLAPLTGPPSRRHVPQALDLQPVDTATAFQQLNDLGDWQVDGWPTLRVIPDFSARTQSIPLSGRMAIDPAEGPQTFCANLAVHRGKGDLVICLSDIQGIHVHELCAPFETVQAGGDRTDGYQSVTLDLPASDQPLFLELRIDCRETFETSAEQPAVFFVARPRVRAAQDTSPLIPATCHSAQQRGDGPWYHARLPVTFGPHAREVALVQGRARTALLSVPATTITLLHDHGDAIDLHADTAGMASVWFNGVAALTLPLPQGETRIQIPAHHQTGQPLFTELRDASGTYALWRHWSTPQAPACDPWARALPARSAGLRKHMADPASAEVIPQLHIAFKALGSSDPALTPLEFPQLQVPDVSILLSADADIRKTYRCLAAVLLAWNSARIEVIVTGAAPDLADLVHGITVLDTTEQPAPRGTYVALLDSDTEVTTGWLDALIDGFARFKEAAITGAKLLDYADRVHSAGGMLLPDGVPALYASGYDPRDPRVCYARRVDYLPRTAALIPTRLWQAHPALQSAPAPAMAATLRAAGHAAWYIPASVAHTRADAPPAPTAPHTADHIKDAQITGRILFIAPADDSDQITRFRSSGYKVSVIPSDLQSRSDRTRRLEASGIEVISPPFYTGLHSFLAARALEFDAVCLTGCAAVHEMAATLRAAHPLVRLIVSPVDLEGATGLSAHDLAALRSVDVVHAPDAAIYALIGAHPQEQITLLPAQAPVATLMHADTPQPTP